MELQKLTAIKQGFLHKIETIEREKADLAEEISQLKADNDALREEAKVQVRLSWFFGRGRVGLRGSELVAHRKLRRMPAPTPWK
jgi:hypothetical protein